MNRILKAPEMVTWEITSKCNLKCKHCSNSLGTDNISDLTLEKCKLIINKLFEAGVFKISIEGGEPFVRNDIFQIISYLNEKGYIPRITTNATLITDNIAKELSKYNIGLVQISLDGPNKIVYSGIRRSREAFTKALNGINNLKKYNIKISIAMVLMRENIDYILDLLNLAKSLNVDAVRFIDFIPVGRGNRSFCPTSQQLKKAYELILDYESKNGDLMIIKPQKLLSVLLKNDKENNKISLLQYINHENKAICEAGNVIAHIKSNGDVTPCVYFREKSFICGNILCQDFSDIWINSNMMNQFRKLESIQGKCNKCKIFNMCMGGCRAYAYYTTGFLNGFDNRCWNIEEEN